jgi:hypothetical protein
MTNTSTLRAPISTLDDEPVELGSALYVRALSDPGARAAALNEAAKLLDGVTPEMRSMRIVRQWRDAVRSAG